MKLWLIFRKPPSPARTAPELKADRARALEARKRLAALESELRVIVRRQ